MQNAVGGEAVISFVQQQHAGICFTGCLAKGDYDSGLLASKVLMSRLIQIILQFHAMGSFPPSKRGSLKESGRPGRFVLKIHFFIEFGLKMIQFKIQFKTKSKIFIQKNVHSIESKIFNSIIHSKKMRKIIQNSQMRPRYGSGALLRPQFR